MNYPPQYKHKLLLCTGDFCCNMRAISCSSAVPLDLSSARL